MRISDVIEALPGETLVELTYLGAPLTVTGCFTPAEPEVGAGPSFEVTALYLRGVPVEELLSDSQIAAIAELAATQVHQEGTTSWKK